MAEIASCISSSNFIYLYWVKLDHWDCLSLTHTVPINSIHTLGYFMFLLLSQISHDQYKLGFFAKSFLRELY